MKLIIFGTGSFAEVTRFYFERDSPHDVVAFCVDAPDAETKDGLPVVAWDDVHERFPAADHGMFVAVGYAGVNQVRGRICGRAREAGYELVSYLSSKATHWDDTVIGDNCFIFEDNTLQPFVTIGDGTVLWSGNHIGHHSTLGSYCFITSHVVVSGHVTVGDYSFIGVNATLRDAIAIGRSNVIGAGAIIMRDTQDKEVYVPARTKPFPKTSDEIGM